MSLAQSEENTFLWRRSWFIYKRVFKGRNYSTLGRLKWKRKSKEAQIYITSNKTCNKSTWSFKSPQEHHPKGNKEEVRRQKKENET